MIEPNKLAQMMQAVPHFQELSIADLLLIVKAGRLKAVKQGEILFWEGEPCAGIFVLVRGEMHLFKNGPAGQEAIMAVISPISMVNEVAVLDHGENSATAKVSKNGFVWHISKDNFHGLMHKYPQIAFGLLPILANRTRLLVSQYEDLSFLPVRSRTAKLILELSSEGQRPIDRSTVSIREMASRISTSPEVVSRSISFLSSRGFILSTRQIIEVLDPIALKELSSLGIGDPGG